MGHLVSRRRSERALHAAAIESAMANKAKSEFLANMSHELRTPLNAIIGFGDLVQQLNQEDCASGKPREFAEHISGAGRHLLGIIGNILDISKIESGTFSLNLQPQSLTEIISSSVTLLEPRMEAKKQKFLVRVPDNIPLVHADDLRVKQILLNLLSNANKFTKEGGEIFLVATVDNAEFATVAVRDTGQGMTPEEVEIALKPFAQIESHYSRQQEGAGLGLPITKALVKSQGGKFLVDSAPGVGTTIVFTLPLATANLASTSQNTAT
jgi:two-component system cell cycle sensor histidine kinase PleC